MVESREDAGAAGPVTAYLVCGPTSSGNRLMASILCRSGCAGEGSTNQPKRLAEIPPPTRPYVVIQHAGLTGWIRGLRAKGYEWIVAIVMVREPIANSLSNVRHRHLADFEDAYRHRTVVLARNVVEAIAQCDQVEIITYEGLAEPFLQAWLPRIGLRYVPGELSLPGQVAPGEICNQNAKHYP